MKYLRTIREELSAAYHAGANYGLLRDYDNKAAISISAVAQLNPEKSDIAIPYFFKGMEETVAQPNAEDLLKVKEILLKQAAVSEKNNVYWLVATR
jgi:zinc protease